FFTGRLGFRIDMIAPADAPRIAVVSGHGVTLRLESEQGKEATPSPVVLRLSGDFSAGPEARARGPVLLEGPGGMRVELVDDRPIPYAPEGAQEFVVSRMRAEGAWNEGRAGMRYRDLIPGRLGGRFIASHIRIPDGGEVPDYVHYHKIRFQMIYCKAGWAR